jgi:hypothetical protein
MAKDKATVLLEGINGSLKRTLEVWTYTLYISDSSLSLTLHLYKNMLLFFFFQVSSIHISRPCFVNHHF